MKNKIIIIVFFLFSYFGFAQVWGLDQDFNTVGFNITNLTPNGDDTAKCLTIQNDGKILTAGSGLQIVRYNANGTLDTSFNGIGYTAPFGTNTSLNFINQILIRPDNKIIVVGSIYTNRYFLYLALYNLDGTIDSSFGSSGRTLISLGNNIISYGVNNAVYTPQGQILIGGNSFFSQDGDFSIIRCTSSGNLDPTFGTNGISTVDGIGNDIGGKIALRSDGKIIVSGNSDSNISIGTLKRHALLLLNQNGDLDTAFGVNGKVFTNFNLNNSQTISSLRVLSNDKMIVAGQLYNSSTNQYDFFITKYNSDGTLDNTFAIDGKTIINFNEFFLSQNSDDFVEAIAIQTDGKIVVTGFSIENIMGSKNQFALARLNANGTLDTTFGQNGKIVMPINGFSDFISDIECQNDGKVVVTGTAKVNTLDRAYVVARYTPNSTLTTNQNNNSFVDDFKIFPNPVQNKLNVSSNKFNFLNENSTFTIYSIEGKKMDKVNLDNKQLSNNELIIDVSILPSGYYFFNAFDGLTTRSIKFIKK